MNSLIKLIKDGVKKVEIINMMYGINPDKSKSGDKKTLFQMRILKHVGSLA